jgi:outer membrane lipoprotein-sorting protein
MTTRSSHTLAGPVLAAALAALLALAPAAPSLAESTTQSALTAADKADIARVEAYLNSIHTMQSKFAQLAPNGGLARGTIYLQRPGKMRVEYDPPVQDIIVATGKVLIHYDGELEQPSYLPQTSSPAAFLLRDQIKLAGDVSVTRVAHNGNQLLVDVIETGSAEKGGLHLVFTDNPLQLRQWTVLDAAGKRTEVTLINPQFNIAIDPVRFLFETPSRRPTTPQQ